VHEPGEEAPALLGERVHERPGCLTALTLNGARHDLRRLVPGPRQPPKEFDLPEPVDDAHAEAASRSYPWHRHHPFPGCFWCGPDRSRGDGLRIFPGRVPERDVLAAPWVPHLVDADERGVVHREIGWAAFDCPQLWSLILGAPTDSADRVVTGAIEAQLLGPVMAQELRGRRLAERARGAEAIRRCGPVQW
jgi:hypothetical protein